MSKQIPMLMAIVCLSACGNVIGAGGTSSGNLTGGAPGSPCLSTAKEGCLLVLGGSERVVCTGGKWELLEACTGGAACVESIVAGQPGHLSACVLSGDVTAAGDAANTDADATAGDATLSDAKTEDGVGIEDGKVADGAVSGNDAKISDGTGADGTGSDGTSNWQDEVGNYDVYAGTDTYSSEVYPFDVYNYDAYSGDLSTWDYGSYDAYVGDVSYPDAWDWEGGGWDAGSSDGFTWDSPPFDVSVPDAILPDMGSIDPCVYVKPTVNPGCTSSSDYAYLVSLDNSSTAADNFSQIVSDCTLKMGCLAQGTACMTDEGKVNAKGQCIANCIVQASSFAISDHCAWCFGEFSGECGFEKCLSVCAIDSSSTACKNCLSTNCDGPLYDCEAGN